MLESPALDSLLQRSSAWFYGHVWTTGNSAQVLTIVAAAAMAFIVRHVTARAVTSAISRMQTFPRLKALLYNMHRLIFPFVMLVLLFSLEAVETVDAAKAPKMGLIDAAVNLLAAWIVIRLMLQFIGNVFMRNLFAVSIWSIAALQIVGLLPATTKALDAASLDIGKLHLSALSVIKGGFALCFLLYGAIFVSSLIERQVRLSKSLKPSSKVLISKLVRSFLVIAALLVGIVASGIDLSLLALFSGGIGLGIGFGLQRVISNLLSGMMLLLDESIKPGDIIEMPDGAFGWVEKMGARYTEVVTHDFKSYLIPNENLVTQQVVNWSHGNTLIRLEVDFGVHYDSDPRQVKALAREAAAALSRIVADPPPICHLVAFGDNSINFKLRFWISDAENDVADIRSHVLLALWDSFKVHGIKIPYPHRVVYLHEEKAA
jgi:small-conductance mechanosensitive channel